MLEYFRKLGEQIDQAWRRYSYDESLFPQLSQDLVGENPPIQSVAAEDILDFIFRTDQPFMQPTPRILFGEPPVTLFQAARFYIEALFWFSGTTSIHEHGFSGTFSVLAGSSVHSEWKFSPERTINSRMMTGRLERFGTQILHPGDSRAIRSGSRLIHQLFHLELPSVTIVVRTYGERNRLPQFEYLRPGLAIDPEAVDPLRTRRLMFLDAMARGQMSGFREYASKLIEVSELETVYYMFSDLTRRKADKDIISELYDLARRRYGNIIDLFSEVCDAERRTRLVVSLRSKIKEPGPRFLLALLMLVSDRDSILGLIRSEFPGSGPLSKIDEWMDAMSGKDIIGFDYNPENKAIFKALVSGLSEEELLDQLRSEFQASTIDANRDRLLSHASQIARSELFRPLLSECRLKERAVAA